MIADTLVYRLGRFMIVQRPRNDNPAFAQFLVFLDGILVGKQASAPNLSDCEWHRSGARYTMPAAPWVYGFTAKTIARHARQKKKLSLIEDI